jgi:hypothetical protein
MAAFRFSSGSRVAGAWLAGILLLLAHGPASAGDPKPLAPAADRESPSIAAAQGDAKRPETPGPLNSAVDFLSQAALQTGMESDARELDLLRSARTGLRLAEDAACCAVRDRIAHLDADLAKVIARGTRQSATLHSTGGAIADMPDRDALNALAREGQSLLRGDPAKDWAWREHTLQAARAEETAPIPVTASGRSPSAIEDPTVGEFGGQKAMPLFAMRF